ncbi:peptidase S9A, prolyl oligopeptidase [Tanacetum coccineum]
MVSYMGMDPMEKCLTKAGLRSWVVAFADVRAAILKVPFLDSCNTLLDPNLPLIVLDYQEFGNPQIKVGMGRLAKYVSRIRESTYSKCSRSIILKTNMARGHFGKGGRSGKCEELACKYAFLMKVMGEAK